MGKVIIVKNIDDSISIVIPTTQALEKYSIEQIAIKSVYPGLPFWVVDKLKIPTDRKNRIAWRLDGSEGEPDGYGNESNDFED